MVWFEYQNFRADLSFLIPKKRIHSHPDGFMPCIQQPLDGDPEVNMFVSRTSLLLLLLLLLLLPPPVLALLLPDAFLKFVGVTSENSQHLLSSFITSRSKTEPTSRKLATLQPHQWWKQMWRMKKKRYPYALILLDSGWILPLGENQIYIGPITGCP